MLGAGIVGLGGGGNCVTSGGGDGGGGGGDAPPASPVFPSWLPAINSLSSLPER